MPNHYPSLTQITIYIAVMILVAKLTPWIAFKIDPIRPAHRKIPSNQQENSTQENAHD